MKDHFSTLQILIKVAIVQLVAHFSNKLHLKEVLQLGIGLLTKVVYVGQRITIFFVSY